jgi:hypothetical protein
MMSSWKELVRSWLKPSPQRGRNRPVRRLNFESLESRDTPSITVTGSSTAWAPVGPTGITNASNVEIGTSQQNIVDGAINGVAVDPFNSAHAVVGAVNGGVWTTSNINAPTVTWTTGSDDLPSLAISEVAFNPVTQGVVYAATGSFTDGSLVPNGVSGVSTPGIGGAAVGLYESTDGGQTWTTQLGASTFAGLRINSVVPTTLNGGKTIFVSTADGSATTGLYRSDDGGATWTQVSGALNSGLPGLPVTSVIADPGDPNRFYAYVLGSGGGVYMLDATGGNTAWVNISNNLPTGVISGADRVLLAASGFGVNPVYAAVVGPVNYASGQGLLGVYRAIPFTSPPVAGQSPTTTYVWDAIGPNGLPPSIIPGGGAADNIGFVADPSSDSIVYIAGDSPNSAATGGLAGEMVRGDAIAETWTTVTALPNPLPAPEPGTVNPLDPGPQPTTAPASNFRDLVFDGLYTILAGTDGGIYQLSNPQATGTAPVWTSRNGNLQTTELYSVAINNKGTSNSTSSVLLGASQDNGAEHAVGGAWAEVSQGGDGTLVETDNTNKYEYYGTSNLTQFYRRNPNGTLVALPATINGSGLSLDGDSTFNPVFAFNQSNLNEFLIDGPTGSMQLFLSTDNGNTFTSIGGLNGAQPANVPNIGSTTSTQITAAAYGTSELRNAAYVATDDGNISMSFDITQNNGSFTYTDFQSVAGGAPATAIAMDPTNPLIAYAVTNNGVYLTTNGQSWVNITGNLTELVAGGGLTNLYSLVLFTNNTPTNPNDDDLLVGGFGGVYKLSVANALQADYSWAKFGAGIPNVLVSALTYDPLTDSLLAGTYGRGAFRLLNVTKALTSTPVVVDVIGGVGPNAVAVYPDPSNSADYTVTDGLGNQESFATDTYPVVSVALTGGATAAYIGTSGPGVTGTTTQLGVQVIVTGLGATTDSLIIDDSADPTGEQVNITPDSGSAPGEIGLGAGDTLFGVGGSIQYSGFDAGSIQFNLGSGANTVDIDDATNSAGTSNSTVATYTVTSTGVTRSSGDQFVFNGLVNLNLSGSNGADTYDVQSTSGTTSVSGGTANNTFNVTSASLGGALTVNGGAGTNTLNLTGTGQDDAVTAQLTDPTGGGNFAGLTQPVAFTQIQNGNFNALGGVTSFTFDDSTGLASGTATDLTAGMVYTPGSATSGSIAVGSEFDLNIAAITDGLTLDGDGTGAGTLDTLLVLGTSGPGLSVLGEPVIGNGQDQITVSDSQVSITSVSAGVLLSPSLATESGSSAATFTTLYVLTGAASGSLGDQVTVTPSLKLNLVVDASGGSSTAGNSVIVSGVGPFTSAETSDPTYGPPQTRITDVGTAGTVGLIGFTTTSFEGPGLPGGMQSSGMIAVGTQAGPQAEVQVYDRLTGDLRFTIVPFPGFDGGLSIAVGDVSGDGIDDLIIGAGAGGGPLVEIYSGLDGQPIGSFYAYASSFRGGVNVSAAATDNSGHANIVTGTGPGGGPNVRIFDGQTDALMESVFVYDSTFRGGVNVAVGDVTQAGVPDLVTSTGAGGGPRVLILNASNLTQIGSFYAFNSNSRSGFSIAVADVIGDGLADIIVGSGPGTPNEIKVFTGPTEALYSDFYPNDAANLTAGPNPAEATGVQVGAADVNGDGIADVLAVDGPGSPPLLNAFQLSGVTSPNKVLYPVLTQIRSQLLYNGAITTGLVVAGGD